MNVFRLAGDMMHLLSVIVLLLKIQGTRSCRGISLKTQQLYVLVFSTRYLDLFFSFVSIYNTVMKIVFLITSYGIVYLMQFHRVIRLTYDKEQDTFRSYVLVIVSAVMALLFHNFLAPFEILWTFSIYLEAVAIFPQLFLLRRTQNIDNLTGNYVFLLGMYRGLYILNWIYRYFTEPNYMQILVWVSGVIQTALYADFFYYYVQSWKNNIKLSLPS